MLHRIGEGEEIASSFLQSIAQSDQFLPTIDRDQPAIFEIAFELLGFDAKIDNVAIAPDKWMKRFDVGGGRSVIFPAINFHRTSFAELDCDNTGCRISGEKQRVFLELHRHAQIAQISPSVIPSEAEESPYCFFEPN